MYTRIPFLASALLLLSAAPGWAQNSATCTPSQDVAPFSCPITFNPQGPSTGVFDFSAPGYGVLTLQFDTVLTTFTLTVTANKVTSIPNVSGDLADATCITYSIGYCVKYDVSGDAASPTGIPVRGTDYRGLITVTLSYDSGEQIDIPVFGHDPENDPNFDENILTSYVDEDAPNCTNCGPEPTMGGRTPGISSFAAFTEPFANGAQTLTVCFLTVMPQSSNSGGNNPIEEVSFKLVAANGNCMTGPYLRDKTATLTIGSVGPNGIVFANLVNNGDANKFHFDNSTHLNIQDINTNGPGPSSGTNGTGLTSDVNYFVTVISTQFSPVTAMFMIP